MMTAATVAEASSILANLASIARSRKDAEGIATANAFGKNGDGLTIRLSAPIVAKIKALRLAEIDALEAQYRRRAAQIGLSLS